MAKDFTINARFKEAIEAIDKRIKGDGGKGLTPYMVAKETCINTATIYNVLDNKSEISSKVLAAFLNSWPISPVWLLHGRGEMRFDEDEYGELDDIILKVKEQEEIIEKKDTEIEREKAINNALLDTIKMLKE